MRDLLDHADLSRYAGQFVWLELNYDAPENRAFLTKYGAEATPLFFVIDPRDEHVTATQPGAMSLQELKQFLDRGQAASLRRVNTQPMPRWRVATPSALCSRKRPSKPTRKHSTWLRPLGPSVNLPKPPSWGLCKTPANGRSALKQRRGKRLI